MYYEQSTCSICKCIVGTLADSFVFIDETGTDRRNCLRRSGYSLRGMPAVCTKLLVHGQRVSAIAAMCMQGILDCCTVSGLISK